MAKKKTITTDSVSEGFKSTPTITASYNIEHIKVEFLMDWNSFYKGDVKLLRKSLFDKIEKDRKGIVKTVK